MGFFDILANTAANTLPGAAIGTGMGLLFQKQNDARQLKMQQQLQNMQIAGQQQLTDYNMEKQLQMWKDTSYGAQKEQMKLAGINPALMYGMGGGGGQTAGQTAGQVEAGKAPTGGGEIPAAIGMGIQASMQTAQIDLIKAQTEKLKTETGKIGGVDTREAETRIQDLTQGIENKKAHKLLTEAETALKSLEAQFLSGSLSDRLQQVNHQAKIACQYAQQAVNETNVSDKTIQDKINTIKARAIGAALQNTLTEAQTDKTKTATQLDKANIHRIAVELQQHWFELDIKEFEAEIKANYPGIEAIGGNIIQQLFGVIDDIQGINAPESKRRTPKQIKFKQH